MYPDIMDQKLILVDLVDTLAISGIIDDIQKHFGIGPSQTSLLRTRIGELRLI